MSAEPAALTFACARCGHGKGKLHELKTWPDYFRELLSGHKTFEIRKNDRGFEVGDTLLLREYDPGSGYSGQQVYRRVTIMLSGFPGIEPGYVVMGLQPA